MGFCEEEGDERDFIEEVTSKLRPRKLGGISQAEGACMKARTSKHTDVTGCVGGRAQGKSWNR